MASSTAAGATFMSDNATDLYIIGLKNAHALEKQATQLIERQLERIEAYPEVEQVLRKHLRETEAQIVRLDEILHSFGEDRSLLKDLATQITGNLAAIGHAFMADEILKNHFANHAFENLEIAAYTSLITMAEATGNSKHLSSLNQTLKEEEETAGMLFRMTKDLTLKYMRLNEGSNQASR